MRIDKILNSFSNISIRGRTKEAKPELAAKPAKPQKSEGPSQKTAESAKKGLSLSLGSKIGNSRLFKMFSKKAPAEVTAKQSESKPLDYREIVKNAESVKFGKEGMFFISPAAEEYPKLEVLRSLQPSDTEQIKKVGLAYKEAALSHLVFERDLQAADPSGQLKEAAQKIRNEEIVAKSHENLGNPEDIPIEDLGIYTDVAKRLVNTPIFEERLERRDITEADTTEQKDFKNAHNYFVKIQDSLQNFSSLNSQEKAGLKAAISKTNTKPEVLQKYLMTHLEKGTREAVEFLVPEGKRLNNLNESYRLPGATPKEKAAALDKLLTNQKAAAPLLKRLNEAMNKISAEHEETSQTHSYHLELAITLNEIRQEGIVSYNDKNLPLKGGDLGQPLVLVGQAFDILYTELSTIVLRAEPKDSDRKAIEFAKTAGFSAEDIEGYLIDRPFKRVFDALDRSGESKEMAQKAADFAKRAGYTEEEIKAYLESGKKTVPESFRKIIR